jgi:hypothetical protein
MPTTRPVLACSLLLLGCLVACQGKASTPAPAADAKASTAAPSKAAEPAPGPAAPAEGPVADGGLSPADLAAAEAKEMAKQGPVAALQGDPEKALGAHLADPRWYRKTLFGDKGKVLDTKRTQADEQGRFSSLIRFEVADTTVEGCADHLQEAVKPEVPTVERETKPDGRIQLSGATDRYSITFLCGEHEGKVIAFVSFQWT